MLGELLVMFRIIKDAHPIGTQVAGGLLVKFNLEGAHTIKVQNAGRGICIVDAHCDGGCCSSKGSRGCGAKDERAGLHDWKFMLGIIKRLISHGLAAEGGKNVAQVQ